jgi:hypothetical protein
VPRRAQLPAVVFSQVPFLGIAAVMSEGIVSPDVVFGPRLRPMGINSRVKHVGSETCPKLETTGSW